MFAICDRNSGQETGRKPFQLSTWQAGGCAWLLILEVSARATVGVRKNDETSWGTQLVTSESEVSRSVALMQLTPDDSDDRVHPPDAGCW